MSSSGKPGGAGDRGKSLLTSARSAMQPRSMSPVTRAARRSPPRTFASPDTEIDSPRRIPTSNRSDGSAVHDDDGDLINLSGTSDFHSKDKPQDRADASSTLKSERTSRIRSSEAEVSNIKSSRGLRSPKESGDIYRKMTDHGPTKSFLNASHLWCLVTKTHNLEVQMHELPARALPLLRSFRDVAVIPGGHDATREFAEFCKEVLSLSENQVVFTSDEQRTFMETSEGFEESVKLRIREAISSSVDSWILMPFAITDALLDLANDLVNEIGEGRIFMFGESLEWMNQFGGKTVLHRHIKNLDQESFVERVNPGIRVAKGFVCSTVQQLLVSFNLLTRQGTPHSDSPSIENTLQGTSSLKRLYGNSSAHETSVKPFKEGSKVVIKPIFGPAGEGHIVVSSVEELRLYDFPFGDVVMEEMLSMDKASDGTHASPSVQYLGNQIMPHLIDKIVVGNSVYGLRTSSASPEFITTICDWTQQLVDAMAPHGMSSFGFLPVNGEPVLTDTHAGSLTTEHFTKLFHQMYGGGCTFCSWNQHPRTGLDVWQFWARLCDRNIAFTPTKDTRGVFPLLFLKNTTATFIALGRDEADVAELRKAAEDLLRDAPVTYRMDSAALSESQRRIWIHSPRPHGRRETLQHSIPARVISMLRPHLDIVILPGCHEPTREFWEFSRDILELDDDQAIFTAGDRLPLDDDIDENIIARLRSIISASQDKWTLVPYCVTPNFQRWSRHLAGLEVTVFGEDLDAVEKYGHHGVLHRHVRTPDTPSVIEQIDPRIRVPRGYVCSTVEDLLEARRLLDIKSLLVKPVHRTTCGEGVLLLTEAEQLRMYDFPLGDVCLEECLVPDKAPDGMALALSMHYNEGVPLGNPVDKLTLGFGGRSLGWRDTRCRKTLQKTANQYLQSITAATNPKGPGGMDFLSAQGKLFLLDLNFGCFTWNHSPKLFQERYAPTFASYYWQCKPALDADVYAVWSRLEGVGIAFHPGRSTKGVYPLLFLRGLAATFIAIAETTEAAEALRRVADSCIKIFDKTVPTVSVVVPKPSFFKKADIMKKSSMRIWATSSSEEMQRPFRRIESSARPICVLRPGKDVVILQGGSETLRDYFEFCREVLRLHDDQVVWTTGKANCLCLDREIDEGVVGRIRDIVVSRPDDSFMLVPMEVSDSFQSWAAGLQDLSSLKVFGETPDWVLTHASKRIMFRSAATPNIPSILEKAAPGCKFLKGYICSSCEELSTAFELLRQDGVDVNGSEGLLLMPSHVGGRMSSTIHSVEELALYDFPFGDVVLQEVRKLDQAPDGLTLIVGVSYLKGSPFGQGFTDCVALGHRIQGIRKSCTSPEFQDRVIRIVNQLLRELQPKGPGTFEFSSIDGEPVLIDVETNRFNPMHYAKLFHEMYAPDSCFSCWNFHPPAGLDVWSFWGRLCDRDVAFTPQSHRGVFPLLFLQRQNSTGTAMFIAIGRDESDVAQVKGIAEEALRELPEEHIKAQVSDQYGTLSGAVRRMWFLNVSADADKTRGQQRFIFPAGLCTLLRRDLDVVVFPWSNPPSREYWEFIRDVLDLNDDQAVFPSTDKPSTEEVDEDLLARLKKIISSSEDKWTLVPCHMNESFLRLAAPLMDAGAVVFGEDMEWIAKYGHKGILHRHMRSLETPSVIEQIDPAIRVPRGYTCSSVEHLLEAYRLLDTRNVVVRPIHCSGGEGTLFLNEAEQLRMYDFPAGDVNLEEALELDKAPDGIILSPTLQYSEGSILGTAPFDQVMVAQACMGWRHSVASTAFHKSARRYAQSIMAAVTPRAAGGFDFVSVNGLPVLADVALGQLGEAHVPFLFQEAHASGLAFFCWRFRPSERLTVQTFWKRLRSSGCGLNPGKSREGIFPASYLRGAAGMFVAVARDELSCLALHEKAKNMLSANAPAPIPLEGPTAVEQRFKLTLIKNAEAIYLPEYVAARHILLGGTQVVGLLDDEAAARLEGISADIAAMVIDATGCVVVPGFVDIHVHITGGGGELGPASRTPEARVNQIIDGGMTTVVGVLGTDCVSRSLENLLVKARALTAEGLTAFMWTGAYRNPPPTLTGSVRRDLVIVEQCIGVGEMAISDHRGSQPDVRLISELAAECRVGGMLAGKAGLLYCHVGTGPGMLEPLRQCVRETEIPITTFLPTHMERNEALIADGAQWLRDGGYIDLTCRSIKALMALKKFDQEGLPLEHVCVSSDSFGSLPTYDELGRLVRYRAADAKAMLQFLWKMYFQELWPLEKILPLVTSNPARILKLSGKGSITVGSDGDVLLLDKNTLQLKYVIAKGQVVKTPKWTHTGMLGTGVPSGSAATGTGQPKSEPRQARRKGARAAGRGDGGGGGGPGGDRGGGGGDLRDGDGSEEVNRGPARYLIGARESRPDSDGAPRAQGGPGHRGMFKWIPGCC